MTGVGGHCIQEFMHALRQRHLGRKLVRHQWIGGNFTHQFPTVAIEHERAVAAGQHLQRHRLRETDPETEIENLLLKSSQLRAARMLQVEIGKICRNKG
ncbi:hypothetical protein SDC9_128885 [bioreactor metagenome]|uniref:Uncharacterized protein n=1 Tax=bioreactor metagenome TaxID=1076179 RepID=A0A645CYB2_9ZZZZ